MRAGIRCEKSPTIRKACEGALILGVASLQLAITKDLFLCDVGRPRARHYRLGAYTQSFSASLSLCSPGAFPFHCRHACLHSIESP